MADLVTIALIQMRVSPHPGSNVAKAVEMIRDSAGRGARVICLPELYRTTYFPREESAPAAGLAETVPGESTATFSRLARELRVVIIVPIFEVEGGRYFNTACVLDADGSLIGTYRKAHIPHDPFFYERSYFEPGNLGYPVFHSRYLSFSVLICYDQWFPEAARIAALSGAQVIFYPTAIGHLDGDPLSKDDWRSSWETIQRSHAIANGIHVAAVNRTGREAEIAFWGSSFVSDAFGKVIARAGEDGDEALVATVNIGQNDQMREGWGFLRNRRPETYGMLSAPISYTKPGEAGLSMPAEWEKHSSTWLAWPHDPDSFPGLRKVEESYLRIIEALHRGEVVDLVVRDLPMRRRLKRLLSARGIDGSQVRFHMYDYADVWFRDYGPIFVTDGSKTSKAMVHWSFNAWGNKYVDLLNDAYVPRNMEKELRLPCYRPHMVLEGGSIDGNGLGTFLTTEQCLLDPSRNPDLSRAEIESYLANYLGGKRVIWLKGGISGDDTDGHVDNVARFVGPRTVLCASEDDPNDENYSNLVENLARLSAATTCDGQPLEVIRIPMPAAVRRSVDGEDRRLPASYLNFYVGNDVVLVPAFGDTNDERALEILRAVFPGREVTGVDCLDLLYGFGGIHCVTQQEPAAGTSAGTGAGFSSNR